MVPEAEAVEEAGPGEWERPMLAMGRLWYWCWLLLLLGVLYEGGKGLPGSHSVSVDRGPAWFTRQGGKWARQIIFKTQTRKCSKINLSHFWRQEALPPKNIFFGRAPRRHI